MLPQDKDLILKQKVKLYNNIGKMSDCEGRLLAELEVYPTPRIIWEFEILGEMNCNVFNKIPGQIHELNPLTGHNFYIEKYGFFGEIINDFGALKAKRGFTNQVFYDDIEAEAHTFVFYLPNAIFHHKSLNQTELKKIVIDTETNLEIEEKSSLEGYYIESVIDDIWSIQLQVNKDALEWLKPENRNTGTLITTFGVLYQQKSIQAKNVSELQSLTLKSAIERIQSFSHFLSFANGGYTAPLYIQGDNYTHNQSSFEKTPCAVALVSQTTPVEQLGESWVMGSSDLKVFMACFHSFERMMQNLYWQETFRFVLNQYFQAIRPKMTWEIKASAAGAALERLSYTILVEEETDATRKAQCELLFDITQGNIAKSRWNLGRGAGQENISVTGKRLKLLLEHIGLTKSRSYNDIDDVPLFLGVRNDAVHPRVGAMTIGERWKLINQAIQWIDEVLLWRLGYNGEYLDRVRGMETSTNPRYELSLRDLNW
ncbi:MAG: hypothetical protein EA343_24230 [Nodularia sp. (in: Bacteria)]|nr:MAG: hypothetical protein EA343_24230 [Nodularia sp. (in: cyanobacteria)]